MDSGFKAALIAIFGVVVGLVGARVLAPVPSTPPMTSRGGGAISGPQLPACTASAPCNITVNAGVNAQTEMCEISLSHNAVHVKPGGVVNWLISGDAEFRNAKHGVRIDGNKGQVFYTCSRLNAKLFSCTRTANAKVQAFSYTVNLKVSNPNDTSDKDIPCAYDPVIVSRD